MSHAKSTILATAVMAVFVFSGCTIFEKQKAEQPRPQQVVTPDKPEKPEPVEKAAQKPELSAKDRMMRVALKMRGKPYSYNGASPKGFNTDGLVYYCHKQVGLDIPRDLRGQMDKTKEIARNKIRPADLLFFALGTDKTNHVGIYLGTNKFIHIPPGGDKVIMSDIRSRKWASALVRGGRI